MTSAAGAGAAHKDAVIFQLLYTSTATLEFWPDDVFELVRKSRLKNGARGLTGMLLFHEGRFVQLLEGPEEAVRDCFAVVEQDPRHHDVKVLLTQTCEDRDFPKWTMGFQRPEEAWHLPTSWASNLEEDSNTSQGASAAKELLLSFQHGLV